MLHLQYLDPQTPPVVRRWHFYIGHEMICGRQRFLDPPSPMAGHCIALTPPQPRWGPSLGGQPGTVRRLVFPKVSGQLCPLRDCRTAMEIAITTGEHGSCLVPEGPWAQWVSRSHVSGAVCGGEKTRTELGARIRPGVW